MAAQVDPRISVRWVTSTVEGGSTPALENHAFNRTSRNSSVSVLGKPDDYHEWAAKMERRLLSSKLWHYIQPSEFDSKEKSKETEQMILNWIRSTVTNSAAIDGVKSASEAWSVLEALYGCGICCRLALGTEQRSPISSYRRMANLGCRYCQLILNAAKTSTATHFGDLSGSDLIQICDTALLQLSTSRSPGSRLLTGPLPVLSAAELNCLKFTTLSQIDMISFDRHTFELCLPAAYDTSTLNSRPPPSRSIESLETIAMQRLKKCIDDHKFCRRPDPRYRPRRLLDVGHNGTDPYLVERSADSTHHSNEYAALSYCWGTDGRPLITTRANKASHLSRIPLETFPQTVYDAVIVCRRLAIRFLWVDALCIIQDDLHQVDWYEQSGEMLEVFSNAHLVIAADISPDVASGFLYWPEGSIRQWKRVDQRSVQSSEQIGGFVRDFVGNVNRVNSDFWELIPQSPLSKRGWALQESILPARILHFTERGISWECNEDFMDSYNMSALVSRAMRVAKLTRIYPHLGQLSKQQSSERLIQHDNEDHGLHIERLLKYNSSHSLYQAWQRVVAHFSQRQLTDPDDKLSALSGLARLVVQALGLDSSSYLAGLWRDNFEKDILWYVSVSPDLLACRRAAHYRAPSWSWACMDGPVEYFQEEHQFQYQSDLKISHASCDQFKYDPTGRVNGGSLTVTGHVQAVTLELERTLECPARSPNERPSRWVPTTLTPNESETSHSEYTGSNGCAGHAHEDQFTWVRAPSQDARYEVLCDDALPFSSISTSEAVYSCLLLGKHYHALAPGSRIWWLVLHAGPAEATFRRVGIGYFHKMHRDFSLFDDAKERTITLI